MIWNLIVPSITYIISKDLAPGSINIMLFLLIWHLVATARASWLPPPPNTLECGVSFFYPNYSEFQNYFEIIILKSPWLAGKLQAIDLPPLVFPPSTCRYKDLSLWFQRSKNKDSKDQSLWFQQGSNFLPFWVDPFVQEDNLALPEDESITQRQELSFIGKSYHS